MSQPTPYAPAHEFLSDELQTPALPGSELDIEFNALQDTLDEILANLALIQSDSGGLKNGVVTTDSLDDVLAAAFGDLESLETVEGLVEDAQTAATAAAASQTAAASSASAAATSATAAASSATSASSSASAASTSASAASTSATAAASSATSAASSATTATTQATNAASSASSASTSASTATTQASNASTSASAASTSATAAASSATSAASSATSAAASYDSFDDRYLGAKAANPTLDNDGNALLTGAMYWNTSTGLKIYDGAAWQSYSASSGAPADADYLVKTANGTLSAERVVTDVSSAGGVVVDWATAAQAKFKLYASAADKFLYSSGANAFTEGDITAAARSIMDDASVAAIATTLGLGTGNSPQFTAIELGHASDTTFSRVSAGVAAIEGKTIGLLAVANDWGGYHQYQALGTITDGANLAWSVNTKQKAKVTLGGNRTMDAVSGAVEGATYYLWVIQDGTGSRTISWTTSGSGSFDFGTDGAPTLTTTASKADLLCFECATLGGTLKLRYAGIKKGYTP